MNCEEVQRKLLEDPDSRDPELLAHATHCAACAGERERALAFERRLRASMEVDPPADLETRLKAAPKPGRRGIPLAVAAALLVMMVAGSWLVSGWWPASGQQRLAGEVLEHIRAEAHYLEVRQALPAAELTALLDQFGARLNGNLGTVYHASRCPLNGRDGVHLVLAGRRGPVTVLLLPGVGISEPQAVASDRFTGVLLPATFGTMAVVGGPGEMVDPLVRRLHQTLVWRI
jgi:hypothetical protein